MSSNRARRAGAKRASVGSSHSVVSAIPVTQSRLSRIAGVDRQKVQYACAKGALRGAMVGPPARRRVDLGHASVRKWLLAHGIEFDQVPELIAAKSAARKGKAAPAGKPPTTATEEAELARLIEQVTDRFGALDGIDSWLQRRKQQADIKKLDLANRKAEGQLIDRDFVATHLFGALDAMQRRMLSDAAKTLAHRMYRMAQAGASVEDMQKIASDLLGSYLKPVKEGVARSLRKR